MRDPPPILALQVYRPVVIGHLHGHHLHRPFFVEAYHGQLVPHTEVNVSGALVLAPLLVDAREFHQ
jgi:hypothetical protein